MDKLILIFLLAILGFMSNQYLGLTNHRLHAGCVPEAKYVELQRKHNLLIAAHAHMMSQVEVLMEAGHL